MIYRLENLIPLPMVEIPTHGSTVWEADSFSFTQDKKYLIEAASGKGKTSLLSIMYGLRKDYRGTLWIDDHPASRYTPSDWSELRKNRVAYIFQGLELFDDLSALENILLKNKLTGFKSKAQILEMAGRLNMDRFLKKKCKFLSFGQKQRIAIIRALCQPFQFLFADECFSHIDKHNSADAMQLIHEECTTQNAGLILTSLGNSVHEFDIRIAL